MEIGLLAVKLFLYIQIVSDQESFDRFSIYLITLQATTQD